jgi:hypothetical protein
MQTFFLRSTELRNYRDWHKCVVIDVVQPAVHPQKIMVTVDPPIPGHLYSLSEDIRRLVLAPRHEGLTLTPQVSEWPAHVYMCLPKEGGDWREGPFRVLDWGVVSQTPQRE